MSPSSYNLNPSSLSASVQSKPGSTIIIEDVSPTPPITNFEMISTGYQTYKYRYSIHSDEAMVFVSWNLPTSPYGTVLIDQDTSDPNDMWVEFDPMVFNPEVFTLNPIVSINDVKILCIPKSFMGLLSEFIFEARLTYNTIDSVYVIYVYTSRPNNSEIESKIDDVIYNTGTFSLTNDVYTFEINPGDYILGSHSLVVKGSSVGINKEYTFMFDGIVAPPISINVNVINNTTYYVLEINTNRKSSSNIEILVDDVVIDTILNANINGWPYTYTIYTISYEIGSHTFKARIVDTLHSESIDSDPVTFTGTQHIATLISYGDTVTYEITSSSPDSIRTGRKCGVYKFNATAGDVVQIDEVARSSWDTYLYLLNNTQNTLTEDDDAGDGTNSRILYTIPSTGLYFIDATTFTAGIVNVTFQLTLIKTN